MAPRASWKGFLKVAELSCPVAIYTAASTSDRIALHTINRATGHRVRREFVDPGTGEPVERGEQVKGYEVAPDEYVVLEPDEIAAAVPESDKVLNVAAFIRCSDVDTVYLDKPYYLRPADGTGEEVYALLREGLRQSKVAALARVVMFRRVQAMLIRPHGPGLIASTMNFDYEVRSAEEAFHDVPALTIKGEMLDLAKHIIATKRGSFDPSEFDDRYEAALTEVVRAKLRGEAIAIPEPRTKAKVVDLMEALRQSAGLAGTGKGARGGKGRAGAEKAPRRRATGAGGRRKAG